MALRLPASNGYGYVYHVQIFQSTALEPSEHFLIGMLRLVPRRVPVKCIQDSPLASGMAIDRENVVYGSSQRLAHDRNPTQPAIHAVEDRNDHA